MCSPLVLSPDNRLLFTSVLLSPPQIVDCNSGRTLDELIKWVEGHADGKSVEEEEEEEEEGEGEGPEEEAGIDHTKL